MKKIIEFTKPEIEKECQHDFIKIHDDGVYCNDCGVSINKMWLINSLKNTIFPDWGKVVSLKKIKDAVDEKNIIRDGKAFIDWIAELRREAESLNKKIANEQQRLVELKYQQDLFVQPDIFGGGSIMTLNIIWREEVKEISKQREWTGKDLVALREMYQKRMKIKDIAIELHRTEGAVKAMAKSLRITNSNRFTAEEMDYINNHIEYKSVQEIADHLKRSVRSVQRKVTGIYD